MGADQIEIWEYDRISERTRGGEITIDREGKSIPAVHVRYHIDLSLCCCDLLLGRELGAAAEEERHLVYVA